MKKAERNYTTDKEIIERFPKYEPPNAAKKFDVLWAEFSQSRKLSASTRKNWAPYFAQLIGRVGSDNMSRVTD